MGIFFKVFGWMHQAHWHWDPNTAIDLLHVALTDASARPPSPPYRLPRTCCALLLQLPAPRQMDLGLEEVLEILALLEDLLACAEESLSDDLRPERPPIRKNRQTEI